MYNILRWFGNLVGERSKGIEVRARDLEQGVGAAPNDSSSDLLYTDREETPLSSHLSVDDLSLSQTSGPPRHEPSDEAPAQNNSEATQKSYYTFTQENKIAVMRNIVSILLTQDTLRLMGKTIVEKKTYQNYEIEYEQMKRQAAVGEAFIEVQQSKMDDVNLTEDFREHVRQDIQNARPRVLEDIRCRDEMERELSTLKTSLEYTRGQMDDIMETLMIDVGILERTAPEHQADEQRTTYDKDRLSEEYPHPEEVSKSNGNGDTIHEAHTYESTVSATESATESIAWKARVRLETAVSRLILAEDQFEQRQEGYYEDVSDYGHDHTRTEIDHFYFRKGAELTRELRDAEDEYYEARAEAMALDLLNNTANQEFDFADEESDGYRESEDPICDVDQVVSKIRSFSFPSCHVPRANGELKLPRHVAVQRQYLD